MQSAPSAVEDTKLMTLAPALAAPGRSPSRTVSSTRRSIATRPASVAQTTDNDPGIANRSLIVEADLDAIKSDRPVIVHHQGDVLTQAATGPIGRFLPAPEVILPTTGRKSTRAGGSSLGP
jgi:hypothetical protein